MGAGDALSNGADQQVAEDVADGVVDDLEMIDIDQQQPERLVHADMASQQFVEVAAIGEPGQRVEIGEPVIALAHLLMIDGDGA